VAHNKGRLGKTLRSERGNGQLPVLAFLPNQEEEANFCASLIKNSVKGGNIGVKTPQTPQAQWSDWAILYRTNAQSRDFETEFLSRNIPYKVVGSLKFHEREEIKDAIALLSFMANPRDEISFRRMVNKPARGIGAVTVDRLIDASLAEGKNLLETSRNMVQSKKLSAKAAAGMEKFIKVMDEGKSLLKDLQPVITTNDEITDNEEDIRPPGPKKKKPGRKAATPKNRDTLVSGEGLSVCVAQILNNSGIAEYHITQDEATETQRRGNMQELVNMASKYEGSIRGLLKFLERFELDRSLEEVNSKNNATDEKNRVTLITFHNTKGLEFRRVIMTGLEQKIFPREDKKFEELEEERRLFYVGATRAMDELYFTSCAMRWMFGMLMPLEPSLFLRELDKKYLKIIGNAPYGFAAPSSGSGASKKNSGWTTSGFAENEAEKASGWRRGQRLFHDDYGYGSVVDVRDSEDGPVVRVIFETGKELRFLSEKQGASVVKIGDD